MASFSCWVFTGISCTIGAYIISKNSDFSQVSQKNPLIGVANPMQVLKIVCTNQNQILSNNLNLKPILTRPNSLWQIQCVKCVLNVYLPLFTRSKYLWQMKFDNWRKMWSCKRGFRITMNRFTFLRRWNWVKDGGVFLFNVAFNAWHFFSQNVLYARQCKLRG